MQHELESAGAPDHQPRGRRARGDGAARGRPERASTSSPSSWRRARRAARPRWQQARDEQLRRDRRRADRRSPRRARPGRERRARRPARALRPAARAAKNGVGAAALRARQCSGCSSPSTPPSCAVIRAAADRRGDPLRGVPADPGADGRVGALVPGPRSVLIEADGGSRGNPGPAAYGAVLKDAETGEVHRRGGHHDRGRDQQRRGVPRADRRAAAWPPSSPPTPRSRSGWTPSSSSSRCRAAGRSSTPT